MSIRSNVDARRLDQRITPQRKVETQDGTGDPVPVWSNLVEAGDGKVWAAVDATKASQAEPYLSNGIRSVSDYTVWIRADIKKRLGLQVLDRILWKGHAYNIADIPDQQLRGRLAALFMSGGKNEG
jgi:head-tail adaptor